MIGSWELKGVKGPRELTRAAGNLRKIGVASESKRILYWTHLISIKPSKTFSFSVFRRSSISS